MTGSWEGESRYPCPHDDDPATCPPCRRAAGKDQPEVPAFMVGRFAAVYEGSECPACHLPIYVGQVCLRLSDGRNVHDAPGCRPG